MKGNTRLCQENVKNYNTLKKEITEKKGSEPLLLPIVRKTPRLVVRNINIEALNPRKQSQPENRRRSKTEEYTSRVHLEQQSENLREVKVQQSVRAILQSLPKKYNQLSLREIVEVEEDPERYGMFVKLSSIVRRRSRDPSRRPSDDYSIEGW
jgi:hypothetical protein